MPAAVTVPAPLATVGFATLESMPIPLTLLIPSEIPILLVIGTLVLALTAAVVVVVIGVNATARSVNSTSCPVRLFILEAP